MKFFCLAFLHFLNSPTIYNFFLKRLMNEKYLENVNFFFYLLHAFIVTVILHPFLQIKNELIISQYDLN